jgi:hypothetical protein
MLPCSPQAALNILACSLDASACAAVIADLGPNYRDIDVASVVRWTQWAVLQGEFWENFANPKYNPYLQRNQPDLYAAYHDWNLVDHLKTVASTVWTAQMTANEQTILNRLANYCSTPGVDCEGVTVDMLDLVVGIGEIQGLPRFLQGLPVSLWTAEVQAAWAEYVHDPSEENQRKLWSQIEFGLLGEQSKEASASLALLQLWIDTNCGPDSNLGCSN